MPKVVYSVCPLCLQVIRTKYGKLRYHVKPVSLEELTMETLRYCPGSGRKVKKSGTKMQAL